jgi:Kdo2-lipid IVA lauroyltransferase/acyltransferase
VTRVLTLLALGLMWLLHWLPLRCMRWVGATLGTALYVAIPGRRRVVMTNLRLCFPERDEAWRRSVMRRHFIGFAQAALDRAYFWWAPKSRLEKLIQLEGEEHLKDPSGKPTILLVPHFIGLDAAGVMMTMATPLVSVYSRLKNPHFDKRVLAGRLRFNEPLLLSRQDGMRRVLKALKDGLPFFYLPDMDYGAKDAAFVPFFGVSAATITGVSRLARLSGARVVPVIARMTRKGYDVTLLPPWDNYPGESLEADTQRMNTAIETEIMKGDVAQYFWSHKRFKTRPPGEKGVY